jgi:hypothetical protein
MSKTKRCMRHKSKSRASRPCMRAEIQFGSNSLHVHARLPEHLYRVQTYVGQCMHVPRLGLINKQQGFQFVLLELRKDVRRSATVTSRSRLDPSPCSPSSTPTSWLFAAIRRLLRHASPNTRRSKEASRRRLLRQLLSHDD